MPRLSSSPHLPQLPCLPHFPGTVQGAGSFASLSSSGYCGACCALALPSSQTIPSTSDVHERRIVSSSLMTDGNVQCTDAITTPGVESRDLFAHGVVSPLPQE